MTEDQTNFFNDRGFATTPSGITPPVDTSLNIPEIPEIEVNPILDPQEAMMSRQMDFVKKSIKMDAMKLSAYDKIKTGENTVAATLGSYRNKKEGFVKYEVEIDDVYEKLNDGSYIAKYDNYIKGTNNEQRLALQQSGWEQSVNGIGKGLAKTAVNILDGTVGTVVGLVNGVKEGSLSAVYNNDFSKWIDDLNTKLDYSLPNYYTEEQKNMNFLESMTTANFWANDFMGGMSFMLGTLGSEAIWAAATGGASLSLAAPKIALRLGAKGAMKTLGKQAGRNFYKNSLKMMKSYNRTVPVSKTAKALSNLRFTYTSAGYEAGVEARHSLDESLESFMTSYQTVLGRKPTQEEYSEFMEAAVKNSNKVFAANLGLVGGSNLLQFGAYFGIGTGLSKTMSKAFGRTFGLGVSKTMDKTGKMVFESLKPNKLQRFTGNIAAVLKTPITEGFIEEGGQGVINKTSQNWLAARFNPDSFKENYGLIASANKAIEETYNTKEGFKEIGIGMLIGFVGGAGRRGATGKRTPFGIGEYGSEVANYNSLASSLNSQSEKFTEAQKNLIDRLVKTNQFNSFIKKSKQEIEKGNFSQASIDWDTAQYTKMMMEDEADMLDDSVADFQTMMERMPDSTLAQEYGLSKEQIADYKAAAIENYKKNAEVYKEAKKIAESVSPTSEGIGIAKTDYSRELALNIYLGVNAMQRAQDVATSIDEYIGTNGYASALRLYTNISKKAKRRVERLRKLETDLKDLEEQYAVLQNSFTSTNQVKDERVGENQEVASQIDKNEAKKAKIFNEMQKKRADLEKLSNKLENRFYKSKFDFGGKLKIFDDLDSSEEMVTDADLMASVEKLEELDSYRELLREENPQAAEALDHLLNEYVKNVKAFRDFNIVFQEMSDPKFAKNEYKGVLNLFSNIGSNIDTEDFEDTALDVKTEQFEAFMAANEERLSEEEKFTLRTLDRMATAFYLNVGVGDPSQQVDPISDEEYQKFIEDGVIPETTLKTIANKLFTKRGLSQREQDIYDGNKEAIDKFVEASKLEQGDSLEDLLEEDLAPLETFDNNTLAGRLKNIVAKIKRNKRYLRQFDINGFEDTDIPTNKDYEEFDKLFKQDNEGKLTPRKKSRLNNLRNKINEWGKLEGTLTDEKVVLSDLLEQIALLESQEELSERVLPSVTALDDLINDKSPTDRNNNYDNLQSYDNAMVSKNSFGEFAIANISLNGFLAEIEAQTPIESVSKNNRKLTPPKNGWNIKNVEKGQRYTIKINDNGITEKIVVKIGSGGNLILTEAAKKQLNTLTNLRLDPSNNLPTNYQPLLKEIKVGDETRLIPVATDFNTEGSFEMDVDAIFNMKEGDLVHLEVSTTHPYNKKLIAAYRNAKTEQEKADALEALEQGMVIEAKDSKNNLVGVHKSTQEGVSATTDENLASLKRIRKVALQRVIDNNIAEDQIVDLGISIPVAQLYLGHPNFKIIKKEDGEVVVENLEFTDEALDKVDDIGYALNGEITLRNNTQNVETFPFLTSVLRDKKYQGRKVPIVVFTFRGHKVAYPLVLKPVGTDLSVEVDSIIDTNLSVQDKILKLNTLMMNYGIDINKNGFTFDNFNQEHIVKVKELLKQTKEYSNLEDWITGDRSVEQLLTQDATININIADKPFHSPKIKTDITKPNGLDSPTLLLIEYKEEIPEEVGNEVQEKKDESC